MKGVPRVGAHTEEVRVLSLFSGVGGLDCGFQIANPNSRTVCYVEKDEYAAAVLVSRIKDETLDDAPIWDNVVTFDGRPWRGIVQTIIGGFPCQDISQAGKREGITGERSGLWAEYARIVDEIRPTWVFIENVPPLVTRGLGWVLQDLARLGYDAEWDTFRAEEVGAPQRRNRFFLVAKLADTDGVRKPQPQGDQPKRRRRALDEGKGRDQDLRRVAHADGHLSEPNEDPSQAGRGLRDQSKADDGHSVADPHGDAVRVQPKDAGRLSGRSAPVVAITGEPMADADGLQPRAGQQPTGPDETGHRSEGPVSDAPGFERHEERAERLGDEGGSESMRGSSAVGNAQSERLQGRRVRGAEHTDGGVFVEAGAPMGTPRPFPPAPNDSDGWSHVRAEMPGLEPALCRVVNGLAHRAQRLRTLGNAVVPLQAAYAWVTLAARFNEVV